MKNLLSIIIILASVSVFSQQTEMKRWNQIYAHGTIVDSVDLGASYDMVFMIDTGGIYLNSFGFVLYPGGRYASEYQPQCGTGQQHWWDVHGSWKLKKNNILELTVESYDMNGMNYTESEFKELEEEGPPNNDIGSKYLYQFEILNDLYMCCKVIID